MTEQLYKKCPECDGKGVTNDPEGIAPWVFCPSNCNDGFIPAEESLPTDEELIFSIADKLGTKIIHTAAGDWKQEQHGKLKPVIIEALKEFSISSREKFAVEFMDWVAGNNYHQITGTILFRQAESPPTEQLTPDQLFEKFKEWKQKNNHKNINV